MRFSITMAVSLAHSPTTAFNFNFKFKRRYCNFKFRRRFWCWLLVGLVAVCFTVYVVLNTSRTLFDNATVQNDDSGVADTPAVDDEFVNPDLHSFQRKFYSGRLLDNDAPSSFDTDRNKVFGEGKVKVFLPPPTSSNDTGKMNCVPFHLPQNSTVRICVYPRSVDQMISSQIADQGVWEEEHVRGMMHVLHAQREEEVTLIDVGCNVGVFTLAAASLGHRVLAVDPVSRSLELLHQSLLLANLTERVTLLHNGLAHTRRRFAVHVQSGNVGGSSLSRYTGSESTDSEVVWAVCLDDLAPLVTTKAVVVKLDIEGWEERVLRCASDFFQRLDVRAVMIEWLFYRHSPGGATIINFMIRNGLLPYEHGWGDKLLLDQHHSTWPDNVFWIKR